jgi:hypothetical protein
MLACAKGRLLLHDALGWTAVCHCALPSFPPSLSLATVSELDVYCYYGPVALTVLAMCFVANSALIYIIIHLLWAVPFQLSPYELMSP